MVMSTSWIVIASTVSTTLAIVASRHFWSAMRAPQIKLPQFTEGRFAELELEVLGLPPSEPNRHPLHSEISSGSQPVIANNSNSNPWQTAPKDLRGLGVAAAVDGSVPAVDYLWTWNHVDDHLFPAIEQLTHEHVENMADLGKAIQHWDSVSQWSEPNAALVAKVKGHLAEWVAADHLQQAGHAVDMPLSSTQPGWDLDVDHVQVNVKLVDHFSSLGKHFSEYPDIPVLVPYDTTGIPDNAFHFDPSHPIDFVAAKEAGAHTFVDHALSNVDLSDSTQAGLEVGSGHVNFHLPWITMGISAFREGKLLLEGSTEFGRAIKNVAVDTAAVGGGGALGAKGGAAIGTMIAPGIGTLIGGAIGGIAGAIIGRKVANTVKRAPLEDAKAIYDRSVSDFESNQSRATQEADRLWVEERELQSARVKQVAENAEHAAQIIITKARMALEISRKLPIHDAKELLDATEETLKDKIHQIKARIQAVSPIQRYFWPSPDLAADRKAIRGYREFLDEWTKMRAEVQASIHEAVFTERVFDLAVPVEQGETVARQFLIRVGETRIRAIAYAESARKEAIEKVAQARLDAIRILNERKQTLATWVDSEMTQPLANLRQAQSGLISEMRKAGIKV